MSAYSHNDIFGEYTPLFDSNTDDAYVETNRPSNQQSAFQLPPQNPNYLTTNGDYFNHTNISPLLTLDDEEAFEYPNTIVDREFDVFPQLPNYSSNTDPNGSDGFTNPMSISTATSEPNIGASTENQTTAPQPAKLPIPAASTTTPAASTSRLKCGHPGCTTTVSRAGDLRRHMKKHGTPEHACPVGNCNRKGNNGFYRLDKLQAHQRRKHGMQV